MTGDVNTANTPGRGVIRVLAADDQRVVRDGLAMMLSLLPGVEVAGTAADGEEAVRLAGELRPDVVLMDLRMPRCDGIEAIRRLRERLPAIKVIALTTYVDDQSVIEALRAGARGYLTKDASAEEIGQALIRVANGEASIDPAVQHHLLQQIVSGPAARPPDGHKADDPPLPAGLTPREAEVLSLIAEGLTNAQIASRLVVSERTVKSHVNHLLAKIGAHDRAQAVIFAYRSGLAAPGGEATIPSAW
jgi:DNA-binding NarL/FixJ family response regulator